MFTQTCGFLQVPADDDDDDYEPDGLDEALCPCDMNLIIDDDLREILKSLKEGECNDEVTKIAI